MLWGKIIPNLLDNFPSSPLFAVRNYSTMSTLSALSPVCSLCAPNVRCQLGVAALRNARLPRWLLVIVMSWYVFRRKLNHPIERKRL